MEDNKVLAAVVAGFVLVGVLLGAGIGSVVTHKADVAGDFAGGIVPNVLLTANTSTNSLSPILSNFLIPGAVSAGGVGANNQITEVYTAVATYPWTPSSTSAITIGTSSITTAATTTSVAFQASGLVVGDPCEVQYSGTTSTLLTSANVTAVSGSNVTATVELFNTNVAAITMTVTSTVTGVTSTVKTTCFATGV